MRVDAKESRMDETPWEVACAEWNGETDLAPWFAFGRLGVPIVEVSRVFEGMIPDGASDALMAGYVAQQDAIREDPNA